MFILDFFTSKNLIKNFEIKLPNVSKKLILKNYWKVALPASIEGILLNLMLLADLIMVGTLGIEQAAAVGIVSQPKMILQMVVSALGIAITAVVARRKGENDIKGMNSCIKQSFLFVFIVYSILIGIAILFSQDIIKFAGANEEYLYYGNIYFKYIAISIFFKAFCVVFSSAQIGVGNIKIVLISGLIGNSINVILNYIFIFGKFGISPLGIKGAGIATIIGNFIIFIILLFSMIDNKNDINILKYGNYKFSSDVIKPLKEIGFNSFLEHIFERIGLFIFAMMIASLGTVAMGTHHYLILLWDLYFYFGIGMSGASASFTGRKLGEKRKDLAIMYLNLEKYSGLIVSILVAILFILSKGLIFKILSNNNDVILLGSKVIIIVAFLIIPQTQAQVTAGSLRGAGDNRFIAQYSLFVSAILKPIFAYIFAFSLNLGLVGMWLAFFMDEFLKMILAQYRINEGIWLNKEV